MSTFIALLAILPALFAVLPRSQQLGLRLKLGLIDRVAAICCLLWITALEFNDWFLLHFPRVARATPAGMTVLQIQEAVAFGCLSFLILRVRYWPLSARKLPILIELAEGLLWSGNYIELLALIEEHHRLIFQKLRADHPIVKIANRLGRSWHSTNAWAWLEPESNRSATDRVTNWIVERELFRAPLAKVAAWLVLRVDQSEAVGVLASSVFLNEGFIQKLASTRPYLGLIFIKEWKDRFDLDVFVDRYFAALLDNPDSVLYRELRDNQNLEGSHFHLYPKNHLLFYFFADVKRAFDIGVYRPVGNYVNRLLDGLAREPDTDPYNCSNSDFDQSRLRDPVYSAISFFHIMTAEALDQDYPWHMWLYYLAFFVDKMARNYRMNDPLSSADEEFPNRYAYLIYEATHVLRELLKAGDDLEVTENRKLKHGPGEHENDNILKSSAFALAMCVKHVVLAKRINPEFKRYIVDLVFHDYFELTDSPKMKLYGAVLAHQLRNSIYDRLERAEYLNVLNRVFQTNRSEYALKHNDLSGEKALELQRILFASDGV